jgi:hypothetical protein
LPYYHHIKLAKDKVSFSIKLAALQQARGGLNLEPLNPELLNL